MKNKWMKYGVIILIIFAIGVSIQLVKFEKRLNNLESDIFLNKLKINGLSTKTAVITPTQKGFSNMGEFLVAVKKVEPYLDGYKIYLLIGNPTNVTYEGFNLKVKHGRETDFKNYRLWKKSLKEKNISFVEKLLPGYWNEIELILAPAKPEEIKHIKISIATEEVFLYAK